MVQQHHLASLPEPEDQTSNTSTKLVGAIMQATIFFVPIAGGNLANFSTLPPEINLANKDLNEITSVSSYQVWDENTFYAAPSVKQEKQKPLWQDIVEIGSQVPEEEWKKLPRDFADNFEFYRHGKQS